MYSLVFLSISDTELNIKTFNINSVWTVYDFPPNLWQLFSLHSLSFTFFPSFLWVFAQTLLFSVFSSCSFKIEAAYSSQGSMSSTFSPSLSPAELIMGSAYCLLPHQHHKLFRSSHPQSQQTGLTGCGVIYPPVWPGGCLSTSLWFSHYLSDY